MAVVLSVQNGGSVANLGVQGDVTLHIFNETMTVTQIQSAIALINTAVGQMAPGASNVQIFDGIGGSAT